MEDGMIADLKHSYGLTCRQITPVAGGWLNRQWKVSTDHGDVLVKQYSNRRFNKAKLELVEAALQRQIIVQQNGVLCPSLWRCGDRIIRLVDGEIAYMVMDFCPGKLENPDTITTMQMYSLGSACGAMHKAFSQLPVLSVLGFPIDSKGVIDSLWANFRARAQECSLNSSSNAEYRKAVLAQEPILNQLTSGFLDTLPKGIAHEDFTSENILFHTDCVSAIIDFDRNQYSYVWHDIGRAMLSFALKDNQIEPLKVHAFREGYSQHLALTLPNIADALRLSWCIEIPWWIQPAFFGEERGKAVRFRDEILWLTEHWFEIDSLLDLK